MGLKLGTALPPPPPAPPAAQSIAKPAKIAKESSTPGKGATLADVMRAIRKEKGERVVNKGSEMPPLQRIPTGMFEFDLATGGGFPRGRYSVLYGPESSGKTNIAYCAIAQAQKMPGPCNKAVLFDLEGTFDPKWAARFGIDVEALIVVTPGFGEEAVDLMDAMVQAEDVAIIVFDSVATVVSNKELEGSTEKADVGTAALLVRRMVNKVIVGLAQEAKVGHFPAVIFINQIRYKIGVMFGDPETQPGGKALLFLASLIIRTYGKNKMDTSVNANIPVFKEIKAVVKKAKLPVCQVEFGFDLCLYEHGTLSVGQTDSWGSVSSELKSAGVLAKADKGGWSLFGSTFKTLEFIKDTYQADDDFRLKCQGTVIDLYRTMNGFMITPAEPPIDLTGEPQTDGQ